MKQIRLFLAIPLAILAMVAMAAPAIAGDPFNMGYYAQQKTRNDQGVARKEMKAGNQLSLREIERRIIPQMRGAQYLGPTYDAAGRAYRLKFIKSGRVMYVDVDARTGRIINRSR